MISFKGCQFPKHVILHAVYFYLRYSVLLRDLEEILAERGVAVDHATLNRWVIKFSPMIAIEAQKRKRRTAESWRMDETYIKVKGEWTYLYRAVDRDGKHLISCCRSAETRPRRRVSSRELFPTTAFYYAS